LFLWLVTFLCAGLFALAWWVSRPVGWLPRWAFRLSVLVMLLALALPPAGIDWVRDSLSAFLPAVREASELPGFDYLIHFILFTGVSGLLFWTRPDLGRRYPVGFMVFLAFALEGLQLLVDGRYASWGDVVANLLGIAIAAAAVWSLKPELGNGKT
jgi:hypothetical protein